MIKKCLPLFITLLFFTLKTIGQTTYVPDDNFEQALIDLGYDSTLDNYVTTSAISGITELDLDHKSIADLTGIEDFVSLTTLEASYNTFTTVNVSTLVDLEELAIGYNSNLVSIDVTTLTKLEKLTLHSTNITSLDVSKNTALKTLLCNAELSALDVSNLVNLRSLYASGNSFTSLDLSKNTALSLLEINNSQLSTIDVSLNTLLTSLYASSNDKITSLDVTTNTNLTELNVSGAIFSSVNVSGLTSLEELNVTNSPMLTSIVVTTNTNLQELNVANTGITSVDVTQNLNLIELSITNTDTTILDISNNAALVILSISNTKLPSIDVTNNTLLKTIDIEESLIESIDLSNNTALEYFIANNSNITALDFSNLTSLLYVTAENSHLTNLSIINTPSLFGLHVSENSGLSCVVVDDVDTATSKYSGSVDDGVTFSTTACTTSIPDDNFEQALIDQGYDDELDNEVLTSNITGITTLDLSGKVITDLTGINTFVSLTSLSVQNNTLTSLDITNLFKLHTLDASQNNLTTLDVTANESLRSIDVSNNDLTSLSVNNGYNSSFVKMDATSNSELICLEVDDVSFAQNSANFSKDLEVNYATNCHYFDTYVPDDAFEQYLIDQGYDDELDDYVSTATIQSVQNLNMEDIGITDVTGLQDFTALRVLNLIDNTINTIDVTQNIALETLKLESCGLTSIDVTKNVSLELLNLKENTINTIDVTQNIALVELELDTCGLTSIDVSKNVLLEILDLDFNNLTSIDLTQNVKLIEIDFEDNNLSVIDLSKNVVLQEIDLKSNNLSTIDLSIFPNLEKIALGYNNLTSLNFENNLLLEDIYIQGNTAITELDVTMLPNLDDVDFGDTQIATIDLSNNSDLDELYMDNTLLTSIDLSNNMKLDELDLSGNQITVLDLSAHTGLYYIDVADSALEILNIANGANLSITTFNASGNTNLTCITVDDVDDATTNFTNIDSGVTFSTTVCKTVGNITATNATMLNYFIDVTFSKGVYNTSFGSGALEISDFNLAVIGGTATTPVVDKLTNTDNQALAGGENVIRVFFSYTGSADGTEVLTINPVENSVYDAHGLALSNTQSNNEVTLLLESSFELIDADTTINTDVTYTNLVVKDGVSLMVTAGNTITVSGSVFTETNGSIKMQANSSEGPAQLIQNSVGEDANNQINIYQEVIAPVRNQYSYTYLSAPVNSRGTTYTLQEVLTDGRIHNLALDTSGDAITYLEGDRDGVQHDTYTEISSEWIYTYDNDTEGWNHVKETGEVSVGKGFSMKAPGTIEQTYIFKGQPNNGYYSFNIAADNFCMVGNPYPSAIDANAFIDANQNTINGSLYFYEQLGGTSHEVEDYEAGYSAYTKAASVAAVAINEGTLGAHSYTLPEQYIPVGQGFFVLGDVDGGTLEFKNDQRYSETLSGDSKQFKTQKTKTLENTSALLRIGVDITSTDGAKYHRQLAVAFGNSYTTSFEQGYDALIFDKKSSDISLYLDDKELVIAAVPFSLTNIPLAIEMEQETEVYFGIDDSDLTDKEIYLYDKLEGTYDLLDKENVILKTVGSGTSLDRYSIAVLEDAELSNHNMITLEKPDIYFNTTTRSFTSEKDELQIEVMSLLGKNLVNSNLEKGFYLVKTTDSNNQVMVVKMIVSE